MLTHLVSAAGPVQGCGHGCLVFNTFWDLWQAKEREIFLIFFFQKIRDKRRWMANKNL